jgi:hypothetical protein
MEAKQYSAAVSALREKAILAGKRVECAEKGRTGSVRQVERGGTRRLFKEEYERIMALPLHAEGKALYFRCWPEREARACPLACRLLGG